MGISDVFFTDKIYLPPELNGLSEKDFWHYKEWQDSRPNISKAIITPFKSENLTPFSDDNPPEKPTPTKIECGNIVFNVFSKKGTKRPRYGDIYKEFKDFLKGLRESYNKGTLRKGYRTIEVDDKKEVYISLETVLEELKNTKKIMLSEKEGVNHKRSLVKPVELIEEVPEILSIVTGTDYSAKSEYNARIYQLAENLLDQGDINTGFSRKKEAEGKFKKILLEDSFERLGGEPDKFVKIPYIFGRIAFRHHIKPKSQPSYESTINAFLGQFPEKLKEGVKIGDFIMLEGLMTPGLPEKLKGMGIWDEEFEQAYKPKIIGGEVYILLSGPLKRLNHLKKESISTSYDQHVSVGITR